MQETLGSASGTRRLLALGEAARTLRPLVESLLRENVRVRTTQIRKYSGELWSIRNGELNYLRQPEPRP